MSESEANFKGLKVLSLESRMAAAMAKLIERYGGRPQVAPSLKEVPLEENDAAFAALDQIRQGDFDLILLMTGVGVRYFFEALELRFSKEEIVKALEGTQVVVRGPKPTAVCQRLGIPISLKVPEPNTWQEILSTLREENLIKGKRILLLEYGTSDLNLIEELKEGGAKLTPLKVYRWSLPDDTAPLRKAFEDIVAGRVDCLLQTTAVQIDHLLQMARDKYEELALRRALARVAVCSIGPSTSARLRERQIFPDYEVFPNKKENLIESAARECHGILECKRARADASEVRVLAGEGPKGASEPWQDAPFLKACRGESVERIPVWLMRQAGRYMAEYQLLRQGISFLDFCKDADRCTEATLGAVERLGVDAAIIFADILLILEPMGLNLTFSENIGPVIQDPIRSPEGIDSLKTVDPERDLAPTLKAIRQVRAQMHGRIPLIGFSGAPFTLASYMIEGKGSRNYLPTKILMHSEPAAWHRLMTKLTDNIVGYLKAQVQAGCQALQVFDSWVGCLGVEEYREFVFPHMQRLFSELPEDIPTVHFGTGTATLLDLQRNAGGDVLGMDWRVELATERKRLGLKAVQGNLDPTLLFCSPEVFLPKVKQLLELAGHEPGFIFNLGHGILPETPVDHVMALVDEVHAFRP